jgi:hypothetical protein
VKKPIRKQPSMSQRDLASHDEAIIRSLTSEHPVVAPVVAPVITEAGGRRADDGPAPILVVIERAIASKLFWTFGMFLEPRHPYKPSMARILLAIWTYIGWMMIRHEILLLPGHPAILNAAWTAWWAAEGMLCFWVAGPKIASYFGPGAAGAAAATAIGAAVRDPIVQARRDKAAAAGSPGTEYNE